MIGSNNGTIRTNGTIYIYKCLQCRSSENILVLYEKLRIWYQVRKQSEFYNQ